MSDLTMWSALVGALLPPVVAVINRVAWPSWIRGLVTIAVCLIAAAPTAWLTGQLTGGTWLHAAIVLAGAALGTYRAFWQPSGIAPAIERNVNPGPVPARLWWSGGPPFGPLEPLKPAPINTPADVAKPTPAAGDATVPGSTQQPGSDPTG